jgi:t-SNARE complex subunit (syntaxin)
MFTSSTTIQKVQRKSAEIVSIFTKTVNDLTTVNGEIETQVQDKEEEKQEIEKDLHTLRTLKEENTKVIGKINQLFQ